MAENVIGRAPRQIIRGFYGCSLGQRDKLEKFFEAAQQCQKILVFSGSGLSAATGKWSPMRSVLIL